MVLAHSVSSFEGIALRNFRSQKTLITERVHSLPHSFVMSITTTIIDIIIIIAMKTIWTPALLESFARL